MSEKRDRKKTKKQMELKTPKYNRAKKNTKMVKIQDIDLKKNKTF